MPEEANVMSKSKSVADPVGIEAPGPPSPAMREVMALIAEMNAAALTVLLAEPCMLSADDFAGRLGLTTQQLRILRRQGRVIALGDRKHGLRYPDWQLIEDGSLLDGLSEVLAIFGGRPVAAWNYLTIPLDQLDYQAPWKSLRAGRKDEVLSYARGVHHGDFM